MASQAEAKKVRLECPLCLDDYKDATLLRCGHTFCKGCLEDYGNVHSITCPVCRKRTKLGPDRVSGLTPNFIVKGVEDKINKDVGAQKASYCTLHSTVYNDIFCLDCVIFICLFCYTDTHKDHKIIKKEEMGMNLRKKRDSLIKKCEIRKTQIRKCLDNATQENMGTHCHLSNLEKNIKDTVARWVTILQENEEQLLKRIDDIRKTSDQHSERYMTHHRQLMDNITNSMSLLTDNVIESSDPNILYGYHLQCLEIENSLKEIINNESMVHLNTANDTRFCHADEKILALGHIEQGMNATVSNVQHLNVKEVPASCTITELPASVARNLKIVRKIDLPSGVRGMTALSQNAVIVGYGWNRPGADCFYVSGDKKPHLTSKNVYDIALFTDGRSVVSERARLIVYDKRAKISKGAYEYPCMRYNRLCSDQNDNIYAVNGTSQVLIFHGNNEQPKRVVSTGNIKPWQICVSKTGVMITSTGYTTPSTITVFDREGHKGTTITASAFECLYAAVDCQDRVLVAKVREESDTLPVGLTRYTLQGLTLIEEVTFNPLKLDEPSVGYMSYMVSLTPNMIAFAQCRSLYFIQIDA